VRESEWLCCDDPWPMLADLRGKVSGRKLRLFACGCVRGVWHLLRHHRSFEAVEAAEKIADGQTPRAGTESIEMAARAVARAAGLRRDRGWRSAWAAAAAARHALQEREMAQEASWRTVDAVMYEAMERCDPTWIAQGAVASQEQGLAAHAAKTAARKEHCHLLRDIVGNPFRPLPPRAFPPHVLGLAGACYAAFPAVSDQFLILADALDDLGEGRAAAHCREPLHVRGCHVLDWVLREE